ASAGSTLIAARTWEACTLPDEHAEPDDTATPLRAKALIAVSPFNPRTVNRLVFAGRGTFSPKITTCGVDDLRPTSKRSRSAASRRRSGAQAAIAAAPNPAMADTIFVSGP